MSLSSWPKKFAQDSRRADWENQRFIDVEFERPMVVGRETDKAIELCDLDGGEGGYGNGWIPVSQIDGDVPELGEEVERIRVPAWLAEGRGWV